MKPPPGMDMEHRHIWTGNTQGSCGLQFFPLNEGAEGNDFKDQKSGEMQDRGFHTSCHPISRPKGFCCFSLYIKQVKKEEILLYLKRQK